MATRGPTFNLMSVDCRANDLAVRIAGCWGTEDVSNGVAAGTKSTAARGFGSEVAGCGT